MNDAATSAQTSIPCPGCGGSGQTCYFAGESRFMLTWEDCPDCAGTGILLPAGRQAESAKNQQTGTSDSP